MIEHRECFMRGYFQGSFIHLVFFNMMLVLSGLVHAAEPVNLERSFVGSSFMDSTRADYFEFFSSARLTRLGIGFLVMGGVANTGLDEDLQQRYQSDVRSASTDEISVTAKLFGEGKYLIPLSLLARGAGYLDDGTSVGSSVGQWGDKAFRAYVVGLPAMLVMQHVTGASRPDESDSGSKWQPFQDDNGVSGHSFVGAVPFLTLARMNDNSVWLKYSAFAASTLAAWSRVNDNKHYLSQAALGWYMAYESVDAVFSRSHQESKAIALLPVVTDGYYGIQLDMRL
jgi:hypothetical protein